MGPKNGLIKYNPQTSELKLFDLANARFYNNSDKRVGVITEKSFRKPTNWWGKTVCIILTEKENH